MFVLEFLPKFVQKQTKIRSTSMRKIRNLRHNKQHGVTINPVFNLGPPYMEWILSLFLTGYAPSSTHA